jgi:hypothetical protein
MRNAAMFNILLALTAITVATAARLLGVIEYFRRRLNRESGDREISYHLLMAPVLKVNAMSLRIPRLVLVSTNRGNFF